MKYMYAWVYFEDEAPAIGSGWRNVFVRTGPKLTAIYCPISKRRKVFKTTKWLTMAHGQGLRLITEDPHEMLQEIERLAPESALATEMRNAISDKPTVKSS